MQAQPSAPSRRLNVFPAAVSGPIREAALRYQYDPDTYTQQKTLKVCGCQTSTKDPEMMAYQFLTGDSAPLAAFAKKMREKEIGLVEVVEGSAFKKALGYAFPAELNPQIVSRQASRRLPQGAAERSDYHPHPRRHALRPER